MEVSRELCRKVTEELKDAVNEVLKRNGLATPPRVRSTYGEWYKVSFEAALETLDDNGVNLTSKEAIAYNKLHTLYGLPAGLLGTKFIAQSKKGEDSFTFIGIASSRSKFPFVGRDDAGNVLLFTAAVKDNILRGANL
jgi:hypothetical protein